MPSEATRELSTPGDYAKAVTAMLNESLVSVDIFSQDLTPQVFGKAALIAAVRGFAFRSRHGAIRILIRDATPLTRDEHRLLALVQRISSKVSVRVLSDDFHSRDDAFVIGDGKQYAQRRQATNWAGVYELSRPEVARQLQTAYNEMWEHSTPDPGVRRLYI